MMQPSAVINDAAVANEADRKSKVDTLLLEESNADRTRMTMGLVVVGALVLSVHANEMPTMSSLNLAIVLLGALYLGLLLFADWLPERRVTSRAWLYFAAQLGIVAAITVLQASASSFGMVWVLLMPLVAQSDWWLDRAGKIAVPLLAMGIAMGHGYWLGAWPVAFEVSIGVGAALLFVLVFSRTMSSEAAARRRGEELGLRLAQANRQIMGYALKSEELAVARERTSMAREIHDSVGHQLTVANVQIQAAVAHLDRDPRVVASALSQAERAVRQGLQELRASVSALRSDPVGEQPIDAALEQLCRAYCSTVNVEFERVGRSITLQPDQALTLYRVCQEALTNARKHAQAEQVNVLLEVDDRTVRLRIEDDGQGCAQFEVGFGLLGVRERLVQLGGKMTTRTGPGQGFSLQIELPL